MLPTLVRISTPGILEILINAYCTREPSNVLLEYFVQHILNCMKSDPTATGNEVMVVVWLRDNDGRHFESH